MADRRKFLDVPLDDLVSATRKGGGVGPRHAGAPHSRSDRRSSADPYSTSQSRDRRYGYGGGGGGGGGPHRGGGGRGSGGHFGYGTRVSGDGGGGSHGTSLAGIPGLHPSARAVKVSQDTNVKGAAGAISHIIRDFKQPVLLCVGAASTNQAIKAVITARRYLQGEGIDLSCTPVPRTDGSREDAFAMVLHRADPFAGLHDELQLKVSGRGAPASIAGAIAGRLKEAVPVSTVSVGADSVLCAVHAIAKAREFLSGIVDLHCECCQCPPAASALSDRLCVCVHLRCCTSL